MIDTHCHLLHGLDDGPASLEQAQALARLLYEQGVEAVVCTPHWSRRFRSVWEEILTATSLLETELSRLGIPLVLTPCSELSPAAAVTEPLEQIAARSIGGRYTIVEVVSDTPAPFFAVVVQRLAEAGLVPVLAHPERSRSIQRDPGPLEAARLAGALVQIVAPSLLGRWGRPTAETAWALVERGTADLLASDAHGTHRRRPRLHEAAAAVATRVGRERTAELTVSGPRRLLEAAPARRAS